MLLRVYVSGKRKAKNVTGPPTRVYWNKYSRVRNMIHEAFTPLGPLVKMESENSRSEIEL